MCFRSAFEFRRWLEKHHGRATELWVGFYKKASGKRGTSAKQDETRQRRLAQLIHDSERNLRRGVVT